VHAERGTIHVVDAAASTRRARQGGRAAARPSRRSRAGRAGDDELTAAKSFRNLSRVNVLHVDDVGVADLVRAATLVLSQARWTT
jgi:large subunit ribosomal protein L4